MARQGRVGGSGKNRGRSGRHGSGGRQGGGGGGGGASGRGQGRQYPQQQIVRRHLPSYLSYYNQYISVKIYSYLNEEERKILGEAYPKFKPKELTPEQKKAIEERQKAIEKRQKEIIEAKKNQVCITEIVASNNQKEDEEKKESASNDETKQENNDSNDTENDTSETTTSNEATTEGKENVGTSESENNAESSSTQDNQTGVLAKPALMVASNQKEDEEKKESASDDETKRGKNDSNDTESGASETTTSNGATTGEGKENVVTSGSENKAESSSSQVNNQTGVIAMPGLTPEQIAARKAAQEEALASNLTDPHTLLARLNTRRLYRRICFFKKNNQDSSFDVTKVYPLGKTTEQIAIYEWQKLLVDFKNAQIKKIQEQNRLADEAARLLLEEEEANKVKEEKKQPVKKKEVTDSCEDSKSESDSSDDSKSDSDSSDDSKSDTADDSKSDTADDSTVDEMEDQERLANEVANLVLDDEDEEEPEEEKVPEEEKEPEEEVPEEEVPEEELEAETKTEVNNEEQDVAENEEKHEEAEEEPTPAPFPPKCELLLFSPCPRAVAVLASYPRSGNSLLRTLYERTSLRVTGTDMRGGLQKHDLVGEAATQTNCVQFVKTHYPERMGTPPFRVNRAVLLVRNPYDAIESYFNLMTTNTHTFSLSAEERKKHEAIFSEMAKKEVLVWRDFHEYWLAQKIPLLVIRYEDLIRYTDKVMAKVLKFVLELKDMKFFEERIDRCIRAEQIEKLGSYKPRSGGIGKSLTKGVYSPQLLQEMNVGILSTMTKFGYEEMIVPNPNTWKLEPLDQLGVYIPGTAKEPLIINYQGLVRGPKRQTNWMAVKRQMQAKDQMCTCYNCLRGSR